MPGLDFEIRLDVTGADAVTDISTALVHVSKAGIETFGALDKLEEAQNKAAASTSETKGQFDEMVAVLGDIRTALTQTVTALQALSKDGAETAAAIDSLGSAQNTAAAANTAAIKAGNAALAQRAAAETIAGRAGAVAMGIAAACLTTSQKGRMPFAPTRLFRDFRAFRGSSLSPLTHR